MLTAVLQTILILQLYRETLCQFPLPFPLGSQQIPTVNMGAIPPMASIGAMGPMGPMSQINPMLSLRSAPLGPPPMPFHMGPKMPSVVMPYYSKSADKNSKKQIKKRRKSKKYIDASSVDSSESDSHDIDFRRSNKRRQVLTPVVSYVTKDGYVVYQKKIKKEKAKDWLEMSRRKENESAEMMNSAEAEAMHKKLLKYKKYRRQN